MPWESEPESDSFEKLTFSDDGTEEDPDDKAEREREEEFWTAAVLAAGVELEQEDPGAEADDEALGIVEDSGDENIRDGPPAPALPVAADALVPYQLPAQVHWSQTSWKMHSLHR